MQSPNAGTGSLFECPGYLWFYREARRAEEVWSPAKATKRDKIGLGLKEATRPSPILPPKTRSSFVGQVMGADSQSRNFGSQERPVAGQEREEAMVRACRSDGSPACISVQHKVPCRRSCVPFLAGLGTAEGRRVEHCVSFSQPSWKAMATDTGVRHPGFELGLRRMSAACPRVCPLPSQLTHLQMGW